MPIDTSMYGQLRPMQLPNPLEQYAHVEQIQAARNRNRAFDMEVADKQQAAARANELNALYAQSMGADGQVDRARLLTGAAQGGMGSQIPALQKQFAEADEAAAKVGKTKSETKKIDHDVAGHQFEIAGQLASSWAMNPAVTKQQIQLGLNAALHSGVISQEIAQAKMAELAQIGEDPQSLNGWAQQTLSQVMKAKESMSMMMPDANTRLTSNETGRHNRAQEANAAAQLGVAQQRLAHDKSAPRGQFIETDAGFVLGDPHTGQTQPVIDPKTGQQIKGKAATRALTEGQGKSTAFAMRAIEAENQLDTLGDFNPNLKDRAAIAAPLDMGRGLASDKAQKYDTSKRNFIASILRKETGAAVTAGEFAMYDKMYFPQVGESAATLADKKRQRGLALEGLMAEAGPGRETIEKNVKRNSPAAPAGGSSAPKPGTVMDGYRFKGGNPADQSAWEKM